MDILRNAIDSIELGVEDYKSNQPKRLISAVRNFYAGILLLFKCKLALLSRDNDEALLKQRVLPVKVNGEIVWKGMGKRTVDFQQIKERFDSLNINVDWKKLEKAQKYRNNIEHYFDSDKTKPEVVREYISGCFVIICVFIREHLDSDPKALFDHTVWEILVKEKQVYEAEKNACSIAMQKLKWINLTALRICEDFTCPECSSDLTEPLHVAKDGSGLLFRCRVCNEGWDDDELLRLACAQESEWDYSRISDGGDPIFAYCPNCSEEYYNTDECVCVKCGAEGPYNCEHCGTTIPICELEVDDGVLCGYCHHVVNKDD